MSRMDVYIIQTYKWAERGDRKGLDGEGEGDGERRFRKEGAEWEDDRRLNKRVGKRRK